VRTIRFRALPLIPLLCGAMFVDAACAQDNLQRRAVEEILTRAVLERGAFLACAHLDTNRQTAELLVKGWRLDLADSLTLLRGVGYSADDLRAMNERFDIEKAAPKFADLASLGAYCDVVGDWRTRWARLLITLPQQEIRHLFRP
jgi:hypothetical protein